MPESLVQALPISRQDSESCRFEIDFGAFLLPKACSSPSHLDLDANNGMDQVEVDVEYKSRDG
jgi:hypothetical protein